MIPDVVSVEPTEAHRLRLVFDDGPIGEVDVAELVRFVGVFEPLDDPAEFRKVHVDRESGTVVWPSGADLDPLVLYAKAKGIEVQELLAAKFSADR